MKQKNYAILFLLFFSTSIYAQWVDSVQTLPCFNREFNIVAYMVTDTNYEVNSSWADVDALVQELNTAWAPICISFKLCDTVVVPITAYAYWEDSTMIAPFMSTYVRPEIIPVILVEDIIDPKDAAGYASLGGIASPGTYIVMKKSSGGGVWIHEFGHYFGLPHTFEASGGTELVDRSNCLVAGDRICDTQSDPYVDGVSPKVCIQVWGVDPHGDYYLPPVDNYMSYYDCGCRFTQMQYFKMAETYLLNPRAHW